MRQLAYIVQLNFTLEWKRKQSYLALLLYTLTTTYLVYLVFSGSLSLESWNALFWIVMLFAAVQAAFRSFDQEAKNRFLFFYGLVRPEILVLGKIAYNFLYLMLIGLFATGIFAFLLGNPIHDYLAYFSLLTLGSLGFASILTFTSALAAKAGNNPALPAVLSIPLLYPLLLTLSKTSIRALTGFLWSYNLPYLLVLLAMAGIGLALAYILIGYLWRD